ncbi:PspA/IM30 family protein [Rahnella sp. PCH160]|uniref:PspA/IM30 family protein n=1 Tax=Rahnella sp. PCH160 TaxID=3447928 RepID=UPI0039FC0DC7
MGIISKVFTLLKSVVSDVDHHIEDTQGIRLLEQHIREARSELERTADSRVGIVAKVRLGENKLEELKERQQKLEENALQLMAKQEEGALLNDVAAEIARLETQILQQQQILDSFRQVQISIEDAATTAQTRIEQFEQQLQLVKATDATQRVQQAVSSSSRSITGSVSSAADTLQRIKSHQEEKQAEFTAREELRKAASGEALEERLKNAGIGEQASSAESVLARLRQKQQ